MKKNAQSRKGNVSTALMLAIIASLLSATGVLAAGAGSLDPAFGTNGIVVTDLGSSSDIGDGIALQADGKILLAGSAQLDEQNPYHRSPIVVRYNSDGTLDTAFGTNGRIVTEAGDFSGTRIAVQSDGKLVVGGSVRNDFGAARYNSNGSIDTSFGTNGIATIHISYDSRESTSDLAIQPDGKIVLVGSEEIGNYVHYAIARFNGDGSPDLNFNDRGFQLVWFENSRFNYGQSVALQGDGKIVMTGTMATDYDPGDGPWITLARFNPDGSMDTSFGTGGMVTSTVVKLQSNRGALAIQANGKIVVGATAFGATDDLAVVRFTSSGVLDTVFGGTGIVISDFGNDEDLHDLAIQQDGGIVVAGKKAYSGVTAFLLARYNTNGSLDTTFGSAGQVVTDMGGSAQSGNGVAIQPDGKIVVGGSSNGDVALARYDAGASNITPVTVAFRSVGAYDGWLLESTETSNVGGSLDKLSTTINVGDNARDKQYRGVLFFKTVSLPDTAIIMSAQLNIKRQGRVGTDPFTTHGDLLLVIRSGAFSNNIALQRSDFSAPGSPGAIMDPFSPLTYNWYGATLSNGNLAFVNRYGPTQFRLSFAKDDNDDMGADFLKFFSGNSVVANRPVLLVTYFVP